MTTDEERREVARRLGENAEAHPNMSLILNLAFADDSLKPDGSMEWRVTSHDAAMRLADLIEPSPSCEFWDAEEQECYSIRTVRPVDRDALLALAGEMDKQADGGSFVFWGELREYARRIREALGVES